MIIIPMAGISSRFFNAGYTKPKYMLEAHGKTLFEHSVISFEKYFHEAKFLFIVKDIFDTPAFVKEKAHAMGIDDFHIIIISENTRGQAETVCLGLEKLASLGVDYNGSITIFNIDTFRFGFSMPEIADHCDAYLEVFEGEGNNWSFAEPKSQNSTEVVRTAEKNPISNLCSTGLYHFNHKKDFLDAFYDYLAKPRDEWEKGELYIAPLYNNLINKGLKVHYHLINYRDVIFCGIPDEYVEFKK
ncbi:glycosyltransferase family 2 protein [Aeromonas rivipollensis]|uniref:glycosyltransferase family 2 protein n=1 Tax=Aeromonas rivipollensis TaxID=948519 RepID=UPI003D1A1E29